MKIFIGDSALTVREREFYAMACGAVPRVSARLKPLGTVPLPLTEFVLMRR